MVGSSIVRHLPPDCTLIAVERRDLDLTDQSRVFDFIQTTKPDVVIDCAAKVGGIHANNTYRAEFIYSNLQIQNNLIHGSHLAGVGKVIFLGSSCIYPKWATQPIVEEELLRSQLEQTNEPYAVAKIAGIKMCESYYRQYGSNFISLMPTNLYGPNDNYHPENSHVLPALLRRFHEAVQADLPEVVIWGTGDPMREFMHVDDLARAVIFCMDQVNADDIYGLNISQINVGTGEDVTIRELAMKIKDVTGFKGKVTFDTSKPNGTMRKLLNVDRIHRMGWRHSIDLDQGLRDTYRAFLEAANLRQG